MNPLELTLGIMTAVGGFVDISELVFAAKAGSIFGYALIWVFAFSTIGIMVFGEMSGRVAAVAKQPVFNLMRHRLGLKLGLVTLVASVYQHPHHLRRGDRRRRVSSSTTSPARPTCWWPSPSARARGLDVGPAVQVDRAHVRPARTVHDRIRALRWSPSTRRGSRLRGGFVPQVPQGLTTKELLSSAISWSRSSAP